MVFAFGSFLVVFQVSIFCILSLIDIKHGIFFNGRQTQKGLSMNITESPL